MVGWFVWLVGNLPHHHTHLRSCWLIILTCLVGSLVTFLPLPYLRYLICWLVGYCYVDFAFFLVGSTRYLYVYVPTLVHIHTVGLGYLLMYVTCTPVVLVRTTPRPRLFTGSAHTVV